MVLYYTAHQVQSLSKASPRFTLYRLSSEAPPKRLASLYRFINIDFVIAISLWTKGH